MPADTIVARATAPGVAALAVIRLSGPRAFDIVGSLAPGFTPARVREARLLRLAREGTVLDHAIVIAYPGPRSFTGENVVEISCHGSQGVVQGIMSACLALGAREAYPGEFTRRAVIAGKLDLMQAEGLADLMGAATSAQVATAINQVEGHLSRRLSELRGALVRIEAMLAHAIDFPEEDDPATPETTVRAELARVEKVLERLAATTTSGEQIRSGALVVLTGPPNAGKSSLFNALLGSERAIVTPVPGTTRDAIEAMVDIRGLPVRLVDTAGIRATDDPLEQLGADQARRWAASATLVLECIPRGDQVNERSFVSGGNLVTVRTKADLPGDLRDGELAVSVVTGEGLAELTGAIAQKITGATGAPDEPASEPLLTRERHAVAVNEALIQVRIALEELTRGEAVLVATATRTASRALEELVGSIDQEELLSQLFSQFCVGK